MPLRRTLSNYHHPSNVRVTFSDMPVTATAQATMEAGAAPVEEAAFEGVAESRRTMAFHNTTDIADHPTIMNIRK